MNEVLEVLASLRTASTSLNSTTIQTTAPDPAKYVPMNDDVRRDFAAARGFDPRLLFNDASPYFWQRTEKGSNNSTSSVRRS